MTITTHKPNRMGLTCIIAGIAVQFNNDLQAEIDEGDLAAITAVDPSLQYKGKPTQKEDDEANQDAFAQELDSAAEADAEDTAPPETEPEDAPDDKQTEEEQLTENAEINFSDLTKAALVDVAKEAGLPSSEWSKLNKAKLIEYLKKKM